ncbi:MAG TPA: hypothetical protein VF784_03335 [Anaerolineales bacterium]
MENDLSSSQHRDVGRRLYAAILSAKYQIGMDFALEHYVPEELDDGWGDLGAVLQSALNRNVVAPDDRTQSLPGPKGFLKPGR